MLHRMPLLALLAAIACTGDKTDPNGSTDPTASDPLPLAVTLDTPPPLSACASAPAPLAGTLTPADADVQATLTLDGRTVSIALSADASGRFAVALDDAGGLSTLCPADAAPCTLDATLEVRTDEAEAEATETLSIADDTERGYLDSDNDGHGTGPALAQCTGPALAPLDDDCDDRSAAISPSAEEQCDGLDNDCSGEADDGLDFVAYYEDEDEDGYGAGDPVATTCDGPPSPDLVALAGDCAPGDPAQNPGLLEVCDGVDNDCDGGTDDRDPEGPTDPPEYWLDRDTDGAYDPTPIRLCDATAQSTPVPPTAANTDCDDTDRTLTPFDSDFDGTSSCDGDCNDSFAGLNVDDADGDGFSTCDGDCRDDPTDPLATITFPGAPEIVGDNVDQDCNGFEDCYLDDDDDNSPAEGAPVLVDAAALDCYLAPFAAPDTAPDCDDADPTVSPLLPETYDNNIDENCDGFWSCWVDEDEDGFHYLDGERGDFVHSCGIPGTGTLAVLTETDCDDRDPAVYPDAPELACDGVIQDCRRTDDGYVNVFPDDGSRPAGTPGEQLAAHLATAPPGAILGLCDIVYEGNFTANTPLTLLGNGATLEGGNAQETAVADCPVGANSVLTLDGRGAPAGSWSLDDLTLRGGCQHPGGDAFGGGLDVVGPIAVGGIDVHVMASAGPQGGAIAVRQGASLDLLRGSTAQVLADEGGAVWIDSDAAFAIEGVPGTSEVFLLGSATTGDGGTFYVAGDAVLSDVVIEYGLTESRGGIAYVSGTADFTDVEFINGIASGPEAEGGVIFASGTVGVAGGSMQSSGSSTAIVLDDGAFLDIAGVINVDGVDNITCLQGSTYNSDAVSVCTVSTCIP